MSVPLTIKINTTDEVMTYVKTHKGTHTYHFKGITKDCQGTLTQEQLDKLIRVNNQFSNQSFFYNTNFEL